MVYVYLIIAIVSEVFGTTFLKASQGFTVLLPTLAVVCGYGLAFYFFESEPEFHSGRHSLCRLVRVGSRVNQPDGVAGLRTTVGFWRNARNFADCERCSGSQTVFKDGIIF